MKKCRKKAKGIGYVTVRKIGKKFVVCISGDPKVIVDGYTKALEVANGYRVSKGRRPKK